MAGAVKIGGDWKYKIYFDPEAYKTHGVTYNIENDELIETLSELVDVNEVIFTVEAFKSPLTAVQLTKMRLYHEFIVFRTRKYYWSIEKQGDGITIQRSKYKDAVIRKQRKIDRTEGLLGISHIKSAQGKKSINDLINWLFFSDELNQPYDWLTNNCQHFAEKLYDFMTKKK